MPVVKTQSGVDNEIGSPNSEEAKRVIFIEGHLEGIKVQPVKFFSNDNFRIQKVNAFVYVITKD